MKIRWPWGNSDYTEVSIELKDMSSTIRGERERLFRIFMRIFTESAGNDTLLINMAGKKVLVADDSITIQKVIRLALQSEGYEIQTASNGNEAFEKIAVFRPDIVLIDTALPERSAFEVKTEINRLGDLEETRFILMSSAFEAVDEVQARGLQFHGRLTKPFDPAQLRQVLGAILTGKRSGPPPLPVSSEGPPPLMPPPLEMDEVIPNFQVASLGSLGGFPPLPELELPSLPPAREELSFSLAPPLPEVVDLPPMTPPSFESLPPLAIDEFAADVLPPLPSQGFGLHTPAAVEASDVLELPPDLPLGTTPELPEFFSQLPPLGRESSEELDIRSLTASTLEMSNRDDEAWARPSSPAATDEVESVKSKAPAFDNDMIETMVREQVQITLEKLARNLVPEIAEKIIKQEIHRLLKE